MAGKAAGPPPSGRGEADAPRASDGEQPRQEERYGALTVVRMRKDDGRSLMLYGRAEPESK